MSLLNSLRFTTAALLLCWCGWSNSAEEAIRTVSRQTWDTESGLPQNTVQAIMQTSDGYMWFATEGGLARFNSEQFTIFNTQTTPQIRSNDIRALLQDQSGTLWIGTGDGLASFKDGAFMLFTITDGLPSNAIVGLFHGNHHEACAVTLNGIACFNRERFVTMAIPPPAQPGAAAAYESLQPFVTSVVLCSYRDSEGDVWIGTESSGVTILRDLPFEAFSDRGAGLDDQIRCVYRDRSGAVWFGTDSRGLTRYKDQKFIRFTVADGLSSDVIVSLGQDASGDLLIGTPDGLNRLHNNSITVITSSEGLPDDLIRSIHTDPDGAIWIGTRRGLARLRDNHFQTFTHSDGLGSDLIGSITRDKAGYLWVGTLNGLSRLDGDRFTNFTTGSGLSSNEITALYADPGGSLWIGTQGGGLNRYLAGSFSRLKVPVGLPDVIYGITQDANKNLWLASNRGVFRVGYATSEVTAYGVSDGLRVNECSGGGHPGVAVSRDGGIWFATLKGAAFLRPDRHFDSILPPVVVESVTVDTRSLPTERSINIPPGANRLAFNYAALSFAAPQKVLFRYQLEGFDKNWIDGVASRTAFYTNLVPGGYSFRVIARNGDGIWNLTGAKLTVYLEPHFYQTAWFAALILLLLIAVGYGAYRWRVIQVEAQMESRFEAVLQERNRIAREIHDTLAQGFAGVSVQLEIVSRKIGSSAGVAREHLDQARMLVRSSLAEARRSIWELRSQSSEIEDLASRLSKMAAQMAGGGQQKILVHVRGAFRPLPARTEDELLRIAQEAVTNAIRHAEASQINIELAFDSKLLRMTVADDGRGFKPNGETTGVNGHFGLQGMRERAMGMDAKLYLETAPGAGTKLSVEVAV